MPPAIASVIFTIGIAFLFYSDRSDTTRVSKSLWIPTAWLFICFSRSVSEWLGVTPPSDLATTYVEGSPLDAAVLEVLEVLAVVVVIQRRKLVAGILRRNTMILFFFFYAAVSMIWSEFPFVTFKHWVKGIGDVMMVLIVLTESSVPDAIKCIMTRLGFVFLPLSVLWVKYYPQLGRVLTLSWTEDPVGVATQKNSLGELCDFMGVVLLWRFRRAYNDRGDRKRTWRLLAIGSVLVMAVWLLWSCNSMTSACALSMATIVLLASNRPVFRHKTSLIHVLIAGLLAITIYGLFFQSSGGLIATLGKDPTLTGRTDIWRAVLSVPNSRLVGAGYESFWLGSRLSILWQAFANFHLQEAHSGYVELFLNLGWIGIGLLGALIALGYRKVMCSYRRDADFGSLRIALFLAVIVTGLTEAAFRMMSAPWLMFLLATITPAPTRRKAVSVHEMEHSEAPPDTYITIPEETVSGF